MSKKILTSLLLSLICLPLMVSAASREEVRALTTEAVAYIETHGLDQAREVMHDPEGPFIEGELYVFVLAFDGQTLVHGANPKLVGKNLSAMKDPNGNYFINDMAEMAQKEGSGWVSYMWPHPTTKKLTPKVSFVTRLKAMDAYAGIGIYE